MNAIRNAVQQVAQRAPKLPPSLQGLLLTAITMGLLLASGPQSYNGYVIQLICVYAVAALGLNITTGFAGALSLGQGAAFALGAYVTAVLAGTYEWPFWLALLLGAVSGLVAGAVTGFPAGRLGVIGLAMISLGLVLVVNDMLIQFRGVTGGMFGISGIDARVWFKGEPVDSLWVVPAAIAVVTGLCLWLHSRYRLSRLGQATVAVRDEPIGASALGVSGYLTKVAAFAAGSAFAALGGGLFAYLSAYISPDAFSPNLSILFLVMVVLGGSGSRLGPLAGALILVLVPLQLDEYPHVNTIVYGLLLIVLMRLRPRGLFSRSAAPAPKALQAITDAPPAPEPAPEQTRGKPGKPVLEVHDVKRSFGGVYALNGVSFTVHSGEIVGLIGPNGSGKTTLLNVVSGHYPPTSGRVVLDGAELGRQSPEAIARRGIARTFQTPKTFPGMSIEEHLALATQHNADPELQSACRRAVRTLLELGGLDPHDRAAMTRESRAMSHGQLRFLEAATAISGCPRVLLLDEPAAGLSASEIEGFERVVADVAAAGVAVIVVEHHLDMIGRLVDRVVVLDLGTVLWEGPPAELHDVDSVRAAYMGVR
ncbi:ATP-binding cassette domain-containing protein [Dactylosporangium sp. AC04546]|uniref:branched-chain amino acid ABC transporter ATP-binding protein/permease n=1 Tax=Dactylosporangium sp. AC04546 TaxID=2862460 RepID=UPI001EDEEBBA|nr:ATP-binding cassette domain-containing protein [Dactylosporangium sp. AC04546]WVK88465.1 ATP-binding cassette domain-containing protein [Dactylosporangium sp. AC04546]